MSKKTIILELNRKCANGFIVIYVDWI